MDQIIIRKASLNDLDTLLCFEQALMDSDRSFDNTIKAEANYYDIEKMITASNVEIVVAELNDEIIGSGFARIENSKPYLKHQSHAYLGFMYVDPNHRGKGVSKKIIEALKRWAISQNVNEMQLRVYHDNLTAIKAYEKVGFIKNILEMRIDLKED